MRQICHNLLLEIVRDLPYFNFPLKLSEYGHLPSRHDITAICQPKGSTQQAPYLQINFN